MKTFTPKSVAATLAAFMIGVPTAAMADRDRTDDDKDDKFAARLSGYNEVQLHSRAYAGAARRRVDPGPREFPGGDRRQREHHPVRAELRGPGE